MIIPPTQLVVRSYVAYKQDRVVLLNPTNAVGGLFILSLTSLRVTLRLIGARLDINDPPTALVEFGIAVRCRV